MNSKTNRLNHSFQIAYFLAGSCHTPDAAYALLSDLRDDRKMALDSYHANLIRQKARRVKTERLLTHVDEVIRLEAEADILEMEFGEELGQKNYNAALDELSFIQKCIDAIQPLRKYSHLTDPEAHEAAQSEEWRLELIHRAENCMLTTGSISTDHFATMRLHPEFKDKILPAIDTMRHLMASDPSKLLETLTAPKLFNLPSLVQLENTKP